jgi:ribose transport system substrate-binding protein
MTAFRRRRPLRALAVAVATTPLLLAAACSHASDAGTTGDKTGTKALPKTLVFSPLSLAPPALKGLSEGVKAMAGAQGWEVIVQDPNFDSTKQIQQLNEVIGSGRAGAAWILANAPRSMGDLIRTAQAKGVPLLVNGQPAEYGFSGPQPGVTFDYVDYPAGGKALGEQLGKCLTERNGGSGKVLYVGSQEGSAGKEDFDKAAAEAFKAAAPGATLVQTIVAVDRAKAQTDIGNVLQGNPDLAGVFAANDEGALGALGAADAAGKKLTCITDFGGNDEVLKDVTGGKIYASVALQFNDDTKQSFDTLVKMQSDPRANGDILVVPQKTFTAGS